MKSTTLFQNQKLRLCPAGLFLPSRSLVCHRRSSTRTASLEAYLQEELSTRPENDIYDYITKTNSHLLNITLADFLPSSCYPHGFSRSDLRPPRSEKFLPGDLRGGNPLALGHHLVYFAPQVLNSDLLRDGTDSLHSPGRLFPRRLWAGGSLSFNRDNQYQLHTSNMFALCKEDISRVWVRGQEGEEKVFVTIKRRIGGFRQSLGTDQWEGKAQVGGSSVDSSADQFGNGSKLEKLALVETRNLVFMREKPKEAVRQDAQKISRGLKSILSPLLPDFSVSLIPTQALLFRFSALTFNAHRIHLDPEYCREVEGYRNLLVHGPLTLVLMFSVLKTQLREGETVVEFNYRNLVPLYAEEEMKICVRRNPTREERFDVWIEGLEGQIAVRGSAIIGKEFPVGSKSFKGPAGDDLSNGTAGQEMGEEAEVDHKSILRNDGSS